MVSQLSWKTGIWLAALFLLLVESSHCQDDNAVATINSTTSTPECNITLVKLHFQGFANNSVDVKEPQSEDNSRIIIHNKTAFLTTIQRDGLNVSAIEAEMNFTIVFQDPYVGLDTGYYKFFNNHTFTSLLHTFCSQEEATVAYPMVDKEFDDIVEIVHRFNNTINFIWVGIQKNNSDYVTVPGNEVVEYYNHIDFEEKPTGNCVGFNPSNRSLFLSNCREKAPFVCKLNTLFFEITQADFE